MSDNNRIHTFSFTDSFIDRLSGHMVENYLNKGHDLSKLCVVFGGKRPALFLKRELARRFGRAYIAPQFLTIDELIRTITLKHHHVVNMLDLDHNYIIYQLAKEKVPQILKGRETFAQFLPWTVEILKFMDHLDLELVLSDSLRNIEANAHIGYGVPKDINRLLEHVSVLREAYHAYMEERKIFTRGYQYWWVAHHIQDIQMTEYQELLFCNFFYLHRSESRLIDELYQRGQARMFFQGDERRWPALKRLSKTFGVPVVEGEEVPVPQFNLQLYAAFDDHIQASLVREILGKIKNPEQTVIVLPDPEPLIPLLSEISSVVKDFNVSMGYPLERSSLTSLLDFVFQAQASRRQGLYYARDYLKVMRHPFVKNLQIVPHESSMRVLIHKIEEMLTGQALSEISGRLFISPTDIEDCKALRDETLKTLEHMSIVISDEQLLAALRQAHAMFFVQWEQADDFRKFSSCLKQALSVIIEKSHIDAYPLNTKIAQRMLELAEEFNLARFSNERFAQEEIFRIFKSRIDQEIISFHGSPLKGLQILGLFETRSLNFENVIVLNVNEGVLPQLRIYEPLIPREVMIKLNLDRLELEEEIQRYQFMRLISSAKNVHLIYREGSDKEKSRFIEELIWEEEKKQNVLNPLPVIRPAYEVEVKPYVKKAQKTPAMIEHLKTFRFSASSVNTYLRNPYDFYQNYVLGLREKEDLLDEPENRQVGIFMHGLLQDMYQRFLGSSIGIDKRFREALMEEFNKRFSAQFGRSMHADAFLLRSIMESRLERFIDVEKERQKEAPSKLLYIEKRFDDKITLGCGEFNFVYQVDRVDECQDGTIMIIDYKTGSIDPMPKGIEKIAKMELSREAIRDHVRSFQIPLYVQYLDKHFPNKPINAAFYNLRTMDLDRFITPKVKFERQDINAAFLRALDFIISEILDPRTAFVNDESMF